LLLTDDSGIRELNKAHRGKDEPTNVLSFPQYNADELEEICRISRKYDLIQLGDVVMSFDRIAQEAIEFHSYITERGAHMLVHGALHLIGMDHEKYLDAVDMEREEADILHSLDVWVPYFFNTNWAEHG
jgi:probable rRNA maturation factor